MLTEVIHNVCSNFIPNDLKKIRSCKAPWVTKALKTFIRKKNRLFKSFAKNGQPVERYNEIQNMIFQSSKMVEDAKHKYFSNIEATLAESSSNRKEYWSLITKILNKAKTPEIPPLLENDTFVLELKTKAQIFNDYLILQCSNVSRGSVIPQNSTFNVAKLSSISITDDKTLDIIRSLKPNKAHGWGNVSVRMIKYCDSALVLPLKLIFLNCLSRGFFPDAWKCVNVIPVHKKNEKNLKENCRQLSLLPIFGKGPYKDPKTAADDMNHDLTLIQLWANKWRMSFNPDPRKQAIELIFPTRRDNSDHPMLYFNNLRATKLDKHKHLGFVLDSELPFLSHMNAAISKSRKALGPLKFPSKYPSRETLNSLYKVYIRPHLDYGDVIYHIPCKEDSLHCHGNFLMQKLESVQYSQP